MVYVKKRAVMFFAVVCAAVFCLFGVCGCGKGDGHKTPDGETENSYFLQKIDIAGSDLVRAGGTSDLTATASARDGAGKYVTSTQGFTYESSDPAVATVDASGVVSGVKAGSCDITVKHAEYKAENKIRISVLAAVTPDVSTGAGMNTFGRARAKDGALTFVNALSGFEARFEGSDIKGTLLSAPRSGGGKDYLRVELDGKAETVELISDGTQRQVTLASASGSGIHTIRVSKLTDEDYSSVRLISLSADIHYVTPPTHAEPRITVYGDYVTSGYGLGEMADASATYVFSAAKELGAELDVISAPDASLALGDSAVKDAWDKCSIDDDEPYAAAGDSDYIIINLGENDVRAIRGSKGALSDYTDGYVELISSLRAANGDAKILCCYGMTEGSAHLSQTVRKLVKGINDGGDKKVYALALERCDGKALDTKSGYPNAYGHKLNAEILSAALKKLAGSGSVANLQNKVVYDATKPDISVILLGGQSNMEGNSWWRYLEGVDARYGAYASGFDGIRMSFVNHESDAGNAPSFNAVKLGYGGARNPGYGGDGTTCFGPEIGMARMLHDNGYDNKVVFIKFAIGATYFHNDANNRNWQAKTGTLYKAFIRYADACIAALSESYNVSVDAMCWMQGESDTEQQSYVDGYKSSLGGFVKAVREHFAAYTTNLMFYDAYINWPKDWQGDRPEQINAVKAQLAADNLHYRIIDVLAEGLHSNTEPHGSVDRAHFDAESEIRLGEMFAEAYMRDYPVLG